MPQLRIRITQQPVGEAPAVSVIHELHHQYTLSLIQSILDRAARDNTDVRIVLKNGERVIVNPHTLQSVAVVDQELLDLTTGDPT